MGKPLTGYGKSDGRTSRGGSEPFSGVLHSRTRGLFERQPSGEWEIVVFRLKKQAEKVVWFLIGVNGPSARRMGGRLHVGVSWGISPQLVSVS